MLGYISLVERSQMGAIGRAYHKFMMTVACLRLHVCVLFFVESCKKSKFCAGQWYTQDPVVGGRVEDAEDSKTIDHAGSGRQPSVLTSLLTLTATGLFKRASDSTGTFYRGVFRGEGATENSRAILN